MCAAVQSLRGATRAKLQGVHCGGIPAYLTVIRETCQTDWPKRCSIMREGWSVNGKTTNSGPFSRTGCQFAIALVGQDDVNRLGVFHVRSAL